MTTKIDFPLVDLRLVESPATPALEPQRVLIVGQKLPAGSAGDRELITNIQAGKENDLFGADSHVAIMVRAFKNINTASRLDVLPLVDGVVATQATFTGSIAGTATQAGTITFTINSDVPSYPVDVVVGDDGDTVIAALIAAITQNQNSFVIPTNPLPGDFLLTIKNNGLIGNTTGLKIDIEDVEGLTITFTRNNGTLNPNLTGIFDGIDNIRYQTIVWPNAYPLLALETLLNDRFNVVNNILDGVGVQGIVDNFGGSISYLNGLNNQNIVIMVNQEINEANEYVGDDVFNHPDICSSVFGAVRSLRYTQDASLDRIRGAGVTGLDRIGGPHQGALPYANDILVGLRVGVPQNGFIQQEITDLKDEGGTLFGQNRAGNLIICGEAVTTRKTDSNGDPNLTWKFLNHRDTHSIIREFMTNSAKIDFAKTRLQVGQPVPNHSQENEQTIESKFLGYYQTLSGPGFVLTDNSAQAVQFFKDNLNILINFQTGQVIVDMKVIIVGQIRAILGDIQISFLSGGGL